MLIQSFSVLSGCVPARSNSGQPAGPQPVQDALSGALRARGASGGAVPGAGHRHLCVDTAPRSPALPPPGSALYPPSLLPPRGDLLTIKAAAAAVQSPVPGSKGEDNVPADRIEFLLLQSLLITPQTAHHTAILRAPGRAPP